MANCFIGHWRSRGTGVNYVEPEWPRMQQRNRGSFEQYVSIPAIRRRTGFRNLLKALLPKQAMVMSLTFGKVTLW